jgi:hypothetical protein
VVADVADALRGSGLPPNSLVLEMTESVLMDDNETVLTILRQLKELGVRLAIDDFGTGYSSLSYLHRFPVDILKIDRSFVERLSRMSDDAELARTVVRLGQSLQLVTVAEGVEDHAQFLALRRMGCDIGQGFYFGRPKWSPSSWSASSRTIPPPPGPRPPGPRVARGVARFRSRSVLEDVRRVVPRLPAGDLEAAPDLGVAVDADDLLAGGAPPSLESVGRTLQVHPSAALVARLLPRGGRGASLGSRVGIHVAVASCHARTLM